MVYTVTLNPAIDKTVVISGFKAGSVNRIQSLREDAGGKGINVSKCLDNLGIKSVVAVIVGGAAGQQLIGMLNHLDISYLCSSVAEQTRTNLKIIDPEQGENTDINEPGPHVPVSTLTELRNLLGVKICPGDIVVLSGSLPKGADASLYKDWTNFFQALGALVFLDADGEAMREGIQANPYMIKPNDEELSRLLGKPMNSLEDLLQAGHSLLKAGIQEVVISLGSKGGLFLSKDGDYLAEALTVPVRSTVGAGDSMVAAMAYSKEKNLPREEQIRLAVAMGAASVMCDGTQAPEKALVWELAKQVEIQEVERK